jgi:dihydroxyacetone kinase
VLRENQTYLCDLDAVAGDGDHGSGMVRGAAAAVQAAEVLQAAGAGPRQALNGAGTAWGDRAGGTSGALWKVGLNAFADALPEDGGIRAVHVQAGFQAALDRVTSVGGAKPGDKTMVDALAPFNSTLVNSLSAGSTLTAAWEAAARAAREGAGATAEFGASMGRARVLSARSVGTPDPGATSLALALDAAGREIARLDQGELDV